MSEFKFEIVKHIGVLSEKTYGKEKGWRKELNFVQWSTTKLKYDLCEWSPDHTSMGKGITLSEEELGKLKEFLNQAQ